LAAVAGSVNGSASLPMKKLTPLSFALVAAIGLAAGCTKTVDLRGNLPPADQLALIKVGTTTRDEVQTYLGTPSNVTPFGDETWHYISSTTEQEAFFKPELVERKVITVVFDRAGIVRAMETKGLADGKDVTPVDRETPTAGKDLNLLQQLIGNVGRFSKSPEGK
jgi:outer membrane protein assembly factor BamE (lipoprotein component of BamABCDE complex)